MSNGLLIKSQRINYYTSEKYEFLIKLQASTTFAKYSNEITRFRDLICFRLYDCIKNILKWGFQIKKSEILTTGTTAVDTDI